MPEITDERWFGGANEKSERLHLGPLIDEIRMIATGFDLRVFEERDANGGAAVRELLDQRFENSKGWTKRQTGGIDWQKCLTYNGARVCVGVEVQLSARSDLLVIDIIHLRKSIVDGAIDLGVLIVPDDKLGRFLTDRGPNTSDALRHIREARADDLPVLVISLLHDGPGFPLAKQRKARKK